MITKPIINQKESAMGLLLKNNNSQSLWPQKGIVLKGSVLEVGSNKMLIDLGPAGIGVIMGPELKACFDILGKPKKGEEISAKVLILENEDGYIELSVKEAAFQETWKELEEKFASGEKITAEVAEANKGGLMIKFRGMLGFLPVSQLSPNHYPKVEGGDRGKIVQELRKLLKTNLEVKIIDLNSKEKRIIFSEKTTDVINKKMMEKYNKDDVIEGIITGIVDFGAFVKIDDNIEGLVHISELAWQLIENPSDIVRVGEKVKAKIIDIDNNKISLSIKALQKDPWTEIEAKYNKGDMVEGTITKFNTFGAFVALDKDIHGLCHISEFGTQKKMEDSLAINKKYQFKILSIDVPQHRMALGLIREDVPENTKEIADKEEMDDKNAVTEKNKVSEEKKPEETIEKKE
jgi:small subunit ribosomal protein S1